MEKVLTCYHCGNKTSMKQVTKHNETVNEEIWKYDYDLYNPAYVYSYGKEWSLYLCPVCTEVTMEKQSWFSEETEPNGKPIINEEIIYPFFGSKGQYIPNEVKAALDAALKVKNLEGAICILALRRALEKMCKHKGARGNDLFSKLKYLEEKKILPPIMKDISYILRTEGNSAAHADDVEFDQETVALLIEFTQTIFDYVYTLPEKINKAQERIKNRESKMNIQEAKLFQQLNL